MKITPLNYNVKTKKMKTIVKLLIALTMLISVSCSKKDTVDTHKLKDTAWLREKYEMDGTEYVKVPPYWVQFAGAAARAF